MKGQTENDYLTLVDSADLLTYNFQFDSSRVLLQKAIEMDSGRPEAFLIKSRIYLWYFLGSRDSADYELFQIYSDSVISRTEKLLDENYDRPNLLYITANIYKYRAMAFGSVGNTLDAFWSTKKAVSLYEDIIEIDSSYYAAYGGIGVFEYALSYVPALFNWALALSGLNADKSNGFNFIELAAEKADNDKIEYSFHLSKLLDEHLAEYEESYSLLTELIKQFPKNQLFHYQAAIQLMKQKKLDEATVFLDNVQNINHPKFLQTNSFSNFLLGDIYFRKNNYKRALDYYKLFLTSSKTIDYTGIASLRTAYCYYFLDEKREYSKYLLLASNGNLDLEEDNYAKNFSLELLENGLSESMEILLNIENDFLSGKNDSLINLSSTFIDSVSDNKSRAEIYLYKSSALLEEGQIENAKQILIQADSIINEAESWVIPMKYFNLAKISYLENNYILANNYLDSAEDYNEYLKKKEIQSRINGLRRKIKK